MLHCLLLPHPMLAGVLLAPAVDLAIAVLLGEEPTKGLDQRPTDEREDDEEEKAKAARNGKATPLDKPACNRSGAGKRQSKGGSNDDSEKKTDTDTAATQSEDHGSHKSETENGDAVSELAVLTVALGADL